MTMQPLHPLHPLPYTEPRLFRPNPGSLLQGPRLTFCVPLGATYNLLHLTETQRKPQGFIPPEDAKELTYTREAVALPGTTRWGCLCACVQ